MIIAICVPQIICGRNTAMDFMHSVLLFAWHMVRCVLIVFCAGIFVDWIRMVIFEYLGRVLGETGLFKWIREWDKKLC